MQTLNPRKVVTFGTQRLSHLTRPFEEISEYPSWYGQFPYTQSRIENQRLGDTYYGTSKTDDVYISAMDLPGPIEITAESRFLSSDQPVVLLPSPSQLHSVLSSPPWQPEPQGSDELLVQLKEDLKTVIDEATREGIDSPSSLAIENAEFMIDRMYRISPDEFMIELLPDSGIAVTRTGPFGCSLMVVCDSDGEILVSLSLDGEYQRTTCSSIELFDVCFIRNALRLLTERESIDAHSDAQPHR